MRLKKRKGGPACRHLHGRSPGYWAVMRKNPDETDVSLINRCNTRPRCLSRLCAVADDYIILCTILITAGGLFLQTCINHAAQLHLVLLAKMQVNIRRLTNLSNTSAQLFS